MEHGDKHGMDPVRLDRRRFLQTGAMSVAGIGLSSPAGSLIETALHHAPRHASLNDIEHVVFLMQENRSFDHYFGTLSDVSGFSKGPVLKQTVRGRHYPVFDQFGYKPGVGADSSGYLQPFHLVSDPPTENGQTTNDISHSWGPQHQSWNNGAMDGFVAAHIVADGASSGPVTMGYFTRSDLAFYYALADAFTICDGYHCSVLGPTDPNRVMSISATIDPAGVAGGPVLETYTGDRQTHYGTDGDAGADSHLPDVVPGRRSRRHATGGVVDHAASGRMRTSGGSARVRRVPESGNPPDTRLQSRRVEHDGVHHHVRRERWVLRPRAAAHASVGNSG
jgi:phospholipase C